MRKTLTHSILYSTLKIVSFTLAYERRILELCKKSMKTAIHIYQRSEGHVVMFYSRRDFLCFYTILSVCAVKTGIKVLAVALMYDHIHILVEAGSRKEVESFVQLYSSYYSREFNTDSGLSGRLFERPFGAAVKLGEKNIRTCAGYIYNNHTNKKLCDKADEIRWNFLAYAHSRNPFSPKIVRRSARKKLRDALAVVESEFKAGRFLNEATLRRIFAGLTAEEKDQLTDFIIDTYRFVDYAELESMYRSYEEMVYSFNANTFNDYDINEESRDRRGDDTVFREMAKYVLSLGKFRHLKDILTLSEDDKLELATELKVMTRATWRRIGAYLHIGIGAATPEDTGAPPYPAFA